MRRGALAIVVGLVGASACGALVGDGPGDTPATATTATEAGSDGNPSADGAVQQPGPDASLDADAGAAKTDGGRTFDAGCDGGPECQRVIFVTSGSYPGNFGGAAGADTLCQGRALTSTSSKVQGKKFLAWVSDNTVSVSRLVPSTAPYVLPDDNSSVVAASWTDLLTPSNHQHAINVDENGTAVGSVFVWTGTAASGTPVSTNCGGFMSTSGNGKYGDSNVAKASGWTETGDQACTTKYHLYCIEK